MRLAPLALLYAFLVTPAAGQEEGPPADWKVRFDRPSADADIKFVSMPPGWHITTGPAAILYNPEMEAAGEYRLRAEIFLFPPGERREGFGVFVGGESLEADDQSYLYFLIRKDGRYLIKRRAGSQTEVLVDWTEHPAIVKHEGGEGNVKNVLEIKAGAEKVEFLVNGKVVRTMPRSGLDCEGIVGLRVNHALDIHVAALAVEPAM